MPLFEFAIRSVLSGYDLDQPAGRVAALRAAAPVVGKIRDRSLRPEYARSLAGWLGMEVSAVQQAVSQANRALKQQARQPVPQQASGETVLPTPASVPRPDPSDRRLAGPRELARAVVDGAPGGDAEPERGKVTGCHHAHRCGQPLRAVGAGTFGPHGTFEIRSERARRHRRRAADRGHAGKRSQALEDRPVVGQRSLASVVGLAVEKSVRRGRLGVDPGSTSRSWRKLRTSSPEPAMSTTAMATWPTTMRSRRRWRLAPSVVRPGAGRESGRDGGRARAATPEAIPARRPARVVMAAIDVEGASVEGEFVEA